MIGEYVVCIDNESVNKITINKIYEVTFSTNNNMYCVIDDDGRKSNYFTDRFISLKEYRKQKISNFLNITNE